MHMKMKNCQIVYEFNGNKIANKPLGKRLREEKENIKFNYLLKILISFESIFWWHV